MFKYYTCRRAQYVGKALYTGYFIIMSAEMIEKAKVMKTDYSGIQFQRVQNLSPSFPQIRRIYL